MSLSRLIIRPLSAGILIIAFGCYIEIPGPYRALTPGAFGLSEVSPRVFTDNPAKAPELRALIRKAKTNSARFFGPSDIVPRHVICTTEPCAEIFAMKALGLAIGYHFVLIAPDGINERTLTHERAHIDLHSHMGPLDTINPRFPHWFDEGLASHIASGNRFPKRDDARDADWVRAARTLAEWNTLTRSRTPNRTYKAAARLVGEIEQKAGRHGLQTLVSRVAGGADFTSLYEAIIGQ